MSDEINTEKSKERIEFEINGVTFHGRLRIRKLDDFLNALSDENINNRDLISEWIYNSVDETERSLLSIETIKNQDNEFFNTIFLESFKNDSEMRDCYLSRTDDDICDRYMFSYFDYMKKAFVESRKTVDGILQSITENFGQFVESAIKATQNVLEDIRDIISSAFEKISDISSSLYSDEQDKEIIDSLEKWGKFGWTPHPEAPYDYFFTCPDNINDADEYALKICNKENMDEVFNYLSESKRISEFDVAEAITCFNNNCNKACIMVLFSLIERALINIQIKDKKDNISVCKGAVDYFKKKIDEKLNNNRLLLIIMIFTSVETCLDEYFRKGRNFVVDTEVTNRNQIDHGMFDGQVEPKDCQKLFLLLYNLLEIIDYMED